MKVGEPHPILLRHLAEVRMRLPFKILELPRDAIQESVQLAHIFLEFHGRSASYLLIQLLRGEEF